MTEALQYGGGYNHGKTLSTQRIAKLIARAEAAEKERDHNWQEYLAERTARMEANGREAAAEARAEKAEYEAKRWQDVATKQASWETLWAEQVERAEAAEKRVTELVWQVNNMRNRTEAAEKERDMLKAALERRGEIVFGKEGD